MKSVNLWIASVVLASSLLGSIAVNAQSNQSRKFTCLKISNERGGSYSLISKTGVTMLSPLEYDACNSAINELNRGKATCIQVSRGGSYMHPRPTYALTSVERVITLPMEYDECRQAAYQLNYQ
jgi:hypothetical protein